MKLRIGIIGTGERWSASYLPVLQGLRDRFDVRAVQDEVGHRAKLAAETCGAELVDGYRALIARDDIDAVLVLSESWQGSMSVLAACESGKDVFWATDLHWQPEQSAQIHSIVQQSGMTLMVDFPYRFAPATLRLKELLATQLGSLRSISCRKRSVSPTGSDSSIDMHREMAYLVDWCNFIAGRRPKSVVSSAHSVGDASFQTTDLGYPADRHENQLTMATAGPGKHSETGPDTGAMPGLHAQVSFEKHCNCEVSCDGMPKRPQSTAGDLSGDSASDLKCDSTNDPMALAVGQSTELRVRCQYGYAKIELPSRLSWYDRSGRHVEQLDDQQPAIYHQLIAFSRAAASLIQQRAYLEQPYDLLRVLEAIQASSKTGRRIVL